MNIVYSNIVFEFHLQQLPKRRHRRRSLVVCCYAPHLAHRRLCSQKSLADRMSHTH